MRRARGGRDRLAAARRRREGKQAGEQREEGAGPTHHGASLAVEGPNYPVRSGKFSGAPRSRSPGDYLFVTYRAAHSVVLPDDRRLSVEDGLDSLADQGVDMAALLLAMQRRQDG